MIYNVNTEYENSALLVSACHTILFHTYVNATFSYIFDFDKAIIQYNVVHISSRRQDLSRRI